MRRNEHLLWEYIRGDLLQKDFDSIFLDDLSYQNYFGESFWLEIASTDFSNLDATYNIRVKIQQFLNTKYPQECQCLEIKNIDVLDISVEINEKLKDIDHIKDRGDGIWWLYLAQCKICSQHWLIAQEERQNDVYVLKRLNEDIAFQIINKSIWPDDFDKYEQLLILGNRFNHKVRYFDPIGSRSLNLVIEDLAKEKPGIKLSEIINLLNLENEIAYTICSNVVKKTKVLINFNE